MQKHSLLSHIKSVHEGVNYFCDQCDFKAAERGKLLRHIKSKHEGVKYPCDQCGFKAMRKDSLLRTNRTLLSSSYYCLARADQSCWHVQ